LRRQATGQIGCGPEQLGILRPPIGEGRSIWRMMDEPVSPKDRTVTIGCIDHLDRLGRLFDRGDRQILKQIGNPEELLTRMRILALRARAVVAQPDGWKADLPVQSIQLEI